MALLNTNRKSNIMANPTEPLDLTLAHVNHSDNNVVSEWECEY